MRWLLCAAGIALAACTAHAEPRLIAISGGTYRAVAPAGWDGKRAVPAVLYLHGYQEDSAMVTGDAALVAAVTSLGALMLVPDGIDKSWSHRGAPRHARDDIAFLHAVVADAEQRWPVDRARVFAAGFSIGGSMVWDLACHGAEGFAAFLPFSGDFWTPYPARCESSAFDLRHTHALNDHTFPMTGRALFAGRFRQGDLHEGFAILEAADGCAAAPDRQTKDGDLDCESWTHCTSGKRLELCLHSADHQIMPDWLHRSIAWALRRAAAKG